MMRPDELRNSPPDLHLVRVSIRRNRVRKLAALLILLLAPICGRGQGSPDIVWSRVYNSTYNNTTAITYAPNGAAIFTTHGDRHAILWSAGDGSPSGPFSVSEIGCGSFNDAAYSPNGQLIATISGCTINLWRPDSGTPVLSIRSGGGANASNSSNAIAFSPDGQTLASATSTGYHFGGVTLWRVSDGTQIRSMTGGGGLEVQFSPDGQLVAAIGRSSGGLDIWRVSDGVLVRNIPGVIQSLAFSPDGQWIATSGLHGGDFPDDDTIEIYRVADGSLVHKISGTGSVSKLLFTPDGLGLMAAGSDPNQDSTNGYLDSTGTIRFWRLSDWSLVKTYDQTTGTGVSAIAISSDSRSFAYANGVTVNLARVPDLVEACSFTITPVAAGAACQGESGTVNVIASAACSWKAVSRVNWIRIDSGSTGTGNGSVHYTVASNGCNAVPGSALIQEGLVIVAEQTFNIQQQLATGPGPFPSPSPTPIPSPSPTPTPMPSPAVPEIRGRIVNSSGAPIDGAVVVLNGAQSRKTITDASGNYHFDNLSAGESYVVSPTRANYTFSPSNRAVGQMSNTVQADFAAGSSGNSVNPIDTPEYFVRQQYLDILRREPDEDGFNYWSNQLLACGNDSNCIRSQRLTIAAAFFIEQEAQQTGAFVFDVYSGALGRAPNLTEYQADRQQVVGGDTLDAAKTAWAQNFVQRGDFIDRYQGATTAETFVDRLLNTVQSSGLDLSGERSNLIDVYNLSNDVKNSRAAALRSLADNQAFKQWEYNKAFVLTEYFAYLRRDADTNGYNFWVGVLNNGDPGNYRGMVCSFVTAEEYQQRFGTVVSYSNGDCGP